MTASKPRSPPLAPTVLSLLQSLSTLSSSKLSVLILQQPHLPRLLCQTLHSLATLTLAGETRLTGEFSCILRILEAAIGSDDPSLARRLLPTKDAVISLCILSRSDEPSQSVRLLLPYLVDTTTSEEILMAAVDAAKDTPAEQPISLSRAVRVVEALLDHLPSASHQQARGRASKLATQTAPQINIDELASILAERYATLRSSSSSSEILSCKVHILDAATSLLHRHLETGQTQCLASAVTMLSSTSPSSSSTPLPLLNLTLLADLVIVRSEMIASLRNALTLKSSSPAENDLHQKALIALQEAETVAREVTTPADQVRHKVDLKSLGGGWDTLLQTRGQANIQEQVRDQTAKAKGKGKAEEPKESVRIPSALLDMVEAILPHLATDLQRLERILARPRYVGKSEEEIIQLLLDEGDGENQEDEENHQDGNGKRNSAITKSPEPPIFEPSAPPKPRRANIFNDQTLDSSRLRWATSSHDTEASLQPVSNSLKAQIMARVSAQAAEEEAALRGEEWNPFVTPQEVGFEEELDEQEQEDERLRRNRGLVSERDDDGSSNEAEDDRRSLSDGKNQENDFSSSGKLRGQGATAEGEAIAERILILAYLQHGPSLFTPDQISRKSAIRKDLRKDLGARTGKAWDDSLVESWAKMFERNPRKEALLSSAASHKLLSDGNPNLASQNADHGSASSTSNGFGPNRGRGGRVLGGEGRGGRGGGGNGRGGKGPGGGGGSRGGHSGNDRGARNKERRGNSARTRGADRKARMMGGPGGGV